MSDVVLRCPNCGTTQPSSGECETCHEAEVKWFCPNHAPGRWLDGPACAECAARPKKREAPRPRPATPPAPPPRNASRGAPPPEPPVRDPTRELLEALLGGRRRDPSDAEYGREVEPPAGWRVEPPVTRRTGAPPPWSRGEGVPEIRMPRIPFLGCVGQLVKLAVILIILLVMGTCWFFGGSGIMIGDAENGGDAEVVIGLEATDGPATDSLHRRSNRAIHADGQGEP